jgi:uncharacterized surface protein with fasciclin (FAS1) repeats
MAAAVLLLALLASPLVMAENSVMKQLSSSQFTGFVKLLEHAQVMPEIEAALASGKGLTVFAPTDDALMYHTSPTLLSFLKLEENKEHLRKVVLSHIVVERLSPFQWEGAHKTMAGADLPLSMDAQAFYANNVAVMQYNALVGSDAAVHSIPTLIIPNGLAGNSQFVEEGSDIRRSLMGEAAAPSPAGFSPPAPSSAPKAAAAGLVTLVAAAAALLF